MQSQFLMTLVNLSCFFLSGSCAFRINILSFAAAAAVLLIYVVIVTYPATTANRHLDIMGGEFKHPLGCFNLTTFCYVHCC